MTSSIVQLQGYMASRCDVTDIFVPGWFFCTVHTQVTTTTLMTAATEEQLVGMKLARAFLMRVEGCAEYRENPVVVDLCGRNKTFLQFEFDKADDDDFVANILPGVRESIEKFVSKEVADIMSGETTFYDTAKCGYRWQNVLKVLPFFLSCRFF
jgi:hypothetical protein